MMLSQQLSEAVKSGFIDLEDKSYMDLHRGENLAAEEKALAAALLKTGKAFIRDPRNLASEDSVREMVYRGLRRVSMAHAAAFGIYRRIDGTSLMSFPDGIRTFLNVTQVSGRTGEGWRVMAKLDFAVRALAIQALTKWFKHNHVPVEQGGTERRKATADEFMLMQPLPMKTKGGWYWQFKHAKTRNYVFLNAEKGTLVIPTTNQPFKRGEFGRA
jgi:hypothetical protein